MNYGTFIEADGEFARQINFLAKAISNDETGFFMRVLHIEASEKKDGAFMGVTTDGRRLHKVDPLSCPFDNLEAGDWRVVKSDPKIGWIAKQIPSETDRKPGYGFPAWRRVIPRDTPIFTARFNEFSYSDTIRNYNYCDMVRYIHEFSCIAFLNYLVVLIAYSVWDVSWFDREKAVTFTSGDYFAAIITRTWERLCDNEEPDKPEARA